MKIVLSESHDGAGRVITGSGKILIPQLFNMTERGRMFLTIQDGKRQQCHYCYHPQQAINIIRRWKEQYNEA